MESFCEDGSWEHHAAVVMERCAQNNERARFATYSSLRIYSRLDKSYLDGVPFYLDDRSNLLGTRLLTMCRLGCLQLMVRIAKQLGWPIRGGRCLCCGVAAVEDVGLLRMFVALCWSVSGSTGAVFAFGMSYW